MAATAHQAALDRPLKGGGSERDSFEGTLTMARRKHGEESPQYAAALADLIGPSHSGALAYLKAWSDELYGRSGVGMHGLNPLSYSTIADWARLKGVTPLPHEVDALIALDSVRRHPPEDPTDG